MSFSNELKSEAAKIKTDTFNLILAELSAYVRTCGELKLKDGSWILEFVTENASIARRIFTFLKSYTQNLEIYRKKSNQLNKRSNYIIIMKDRNSIDDLLYDTGFVKSGNYDEKNYKIDKGLLQIDEEIRAFLRASFLGAGSVTDPEKGYHLELISQNEELAMDLKDMINKWNLNAKIATRKSSFIVYLKEAEQISDFMALIGTSQSLLKFENVRIVKDLRNNVNRVVNCETANINKTITASMKQIEDINFIKDLGKFDLLSEDIKEVANLRIENEDFSLNEIAELTNGEYSRSGVNYRLKKISGLAEKLRGAADERNESKISK